MYVLQLMEKAEAREKERIKDEQRRQKKMEDSFKRMLKPYGADWSLETKVRFDWLNVADL